MDDLGRGSVGILTFQRTLNYGAVLQCYALRLTIEKLGFDAKVIDYECDAVTDVEGLKLRYCLWRLAGATRHGKLVTTLRSRRTRMTVFRRFLESEIMLTEPCDRKTVAKTCEDLDFVVVGSDQVWNTKITRSDTTFFLDFIADPSRKKSYAVSIGSLDYGDTGLDYRRLIDGFSSISLREESAARAVHELLPNRTPVVSADPTLLLDAEDWRELAGRSKLSRGNPYVLVYTVSEYDDTMSVAKRFASEMECDLVHVKAAFWDSRPSGADLVLRDASPYDFLRLFGGATATVVSSFHGLCFSILNKVDFYYNASSSGLAVGSRLTDLLQLLGIEKRSVQDYASGTDRPIDWDSVSERLSQLRSVSLEALSHSLSGDCASEL